MTVLDWAVFIILTLVEGYIIYRFARQKDAALIKAVVPAYAAFAAYVVLVLLLKLKIPEIIMVLSMLSLFCHTFFGFYLRLYGRTKTFDRFNHAFGCLAYSQLTYFTLTSLFSEAIPKLFAAIIIFSFGLMLGVIVEILEFASDSRKKVEIKLQKGLRDTDFDLISDVVGSLAAGVFAYFLLL